MPGTRTRQLIYAGPAVNNSRRRHLALRLDKGGAVYEATTISAVASSDTIADSGNALPTSYPAGQPVEVFGLNSNSRLWKTGTVAVGSTQILPAIAVDEAAGQKILVRSY